MSMDHMTGAGLDADVTGIRAALARMPFPAGVDDVLATLVRQRAPSRLLWRVAGLPRAQRYLSLHDLCDGVARGPGAGAPPPPSG